MMKKAFIAGTALAATMVASSASADLSGNFGANSAYVFRGVVVSEPQIFGGLDYSRGIFYAGTWVSSAGGEEEVDLYGGVNFGDDNFNVDLGYIAYLFPSDSALQGNGSHGNASEIYGGIAGSIWNAYAWYGFGLDNQEDDEYVYVEGNVDVPLRGSLGLAVHLGLFQGVGDGFDNLDDDNYIDFGLTLSHENGFSIAATINNMDEDHDLAASFGQGDRPQITVGWAKEFDIK